MSRSGITEEAAEEAPTRPEAAPRPRPPARRPPGAAGSCSALALPLIVSQSFMTVQVFVDTVLLSWHDPREMAASFPAVMWFWLPFGLLQVTAGYASTFVAQYTGAGRPQRVGPAVWQGIHFAVLAGLLFLLMVPAAPYLIALGGHTPALQALEVDLPALPVLRRPADAGDGRGQRVLLRPRPDLDRARHRGVRDGGERRAGPGPDLRPGRVPGDGDRGGRVGDRGRVVGVGAAGPRAAAAAASTGRSSPPCAGGGRSGSCSAG